MAFSDVIPAELTPFTPAGEVDLVQLGDYVRCLIGHGVHGLSPCGTNGGDPAMTAVQRRMVVKEVIRAADGRAPWYFPAVDLYLYHIPGNAKNKISVALAPMAFDPAGMLSWPKP